MPEQDVKDVGVDVGTSDSVDLQAKDVALGKLMQDHITRLEAFRKVGELGAELEADDNPVERALSALPQFADATKREGFESAMSAFGEVLKGVATAADALEAPDVAEVDDATDQELILGSDLVHLSVRRDESGAFRGASLRIDDPDVSHVFSELVLEVATAASGPKRQDIVRASLLTTIVGAFEVLVGDLAAIYFRVHPGALGASPEFSLTDLALFDTVDDARDELIARKVDALDRDLETLPKWLKDHMDIDLQRLALEWDEFVEITQRRHLVVHTGGRVTRRYLAKVSSRYAVPTGEVLVVDADYLNDAIDHFVTIGTSLVFAVWWVLGDDMASAGSNMLAAMRRLARAGRWRVVSSLADVAARLEGPEDLMLHFRVLGWLASSRLHGRGAVEVAVRSWDVSALSEEWHLARLCLLNQTAEAAGIAARLIAGNELPAVAILIDPLYEVLRDTAQVRSAIRDRGITQPSEPSTS